MKLTKQVNLQLLHCKFLGLQAVLVIIFSCNTIATTLITSCLERCAVVSKKLDIPCIHTSSVVTRPKITANHLEMRSLRTLQGHKSTSYIENVQRYRDGMHLAEKWSIDLTIFCMLIVANQTNGYKSMANLEI